MEVPKNICCAKGDSTVGHSSVTTGFKKLSIGCRIK